MRFYGFTAEELTTPDNRNLPLDRDPKLAWALRNREFFPVDVNKASKSALLRIPGIGVRNVKRMLQIRRLKALKLEDLARLNVAVKRAKYFVVTADHNPATRQIDSPKLPQKVVKPDAQLSLFETAWSARTGEL
jgi:predicted DNA-binding helix-hairpin-helix protein